MINKRPLPFLLFFFTVFFSSCEKDPPALPCKETPKADCAHPLVHRPVCGCNGKTYGNGYIAECKGIQNYTEGECEE